MAYYGYPKYVSVAEKRAQAEKRLKKLQAKNPDIQPIVIQGQTLSKTWWGKAWNKNLEGYADYRNRIGRGRSYVRNNAVLDLKIKPGIVEAEVSGSGRLPYSVVIKIMPIPEKSWTHVKEICKGKLESLRQLMAGDFPKELEALFIQEKGGVFPVPKEIEFDCSCPDWADMCKHVAATLYGVGARLDQDPSLFFVLRKVEMSDLLTQTLTESKRELLSQAGRKTSRVIQDESGLAEMFGIDLEPGPTISPSPIPPSPKPISPKATKKKAVVERAKGKKVWEKNAIDKRALGEKAKKKRAVKIKAIKIEEGPMEKISQILSQTKGDLAVSRVIEDSQMEAQQVRNILFRLKKLGKVTTLSRGVYQWIE